jgi:hypothetical protein
VSQPTLDQVWAALPERIRQNEGIMQRLQTAPPRLAAAIYKDMFWITDPDGRGMVRSISDDELLPLMLALYSHQGGTDLQAEAEFWRGVWAQ